MKRFLLALALLTTLPALAGTLTLTTTAARDTRLARATARANALTCGRWNLAADCTQPQARRAFCTQQGAGAVTDCAGASGVKILSTTEWAQDRMDEAIDTHGARADKAVAREAWPKLTQSQRDAFCTQVGLTAGCDPW